jgi:hypothetical protein
LDITFAAMSGNGPFLTVKEFNDWFSRIPFRRFPNSGMFTDPFRAGLDDNLAIKFTHGDLHPKNIIISSESPPRIRALVDWHQSGWLPGSWEYCKACLTAEIGGEWERKYIPMFLEPYNSYYRSYEFYADALGF